jgi:hypothetical protein
VRGNTLGSTYDTVLSVYRGGIGSLVSLGCNDNSTGVTSALEITLDRETVYVMISSRLYEGGAGTLTVNASYQSDVPPFGCISIGSTGNDVMCTSG